MGMIEPNIEKFLKNADPDSDALVFSEAVEALRFFWTKVKWDKNTQGCSNKGRCGLPDCGAYWAMEEIFKRHETPLN